MSEEERLEGCTHYDVAWMKLPYGEAEMLNFTIICELRAGICIIIVAPRL